jgi:hypothetical protein
VNVEDPDGIYRAISWYENKYDFADALHLTRWERKVILCMTFNVEE